MAPLEMNEGTPLGVGYNKLNSFSVEDPAKRPLTFNLSHDGGNYQNSIGQQE
jgi:hypothetical protein